MGRPDAAELGSPGDVATLRSRVRPGTEQL